MLAKSLHHLFSTSLNRYAIPHEWYIHTIVPVHKSGDKAHVTNYYPISLLCTTSKVLEQLVYSKRWWWWRSQDDGHLMQCYGIPQHAICDFLMMMTGRWWWTTMGCERIELFSYTLAVPTAWWRLGLVCCVCGRTCLRTHHDNYCNIGCIVFIIILMFLSYISSFFLPTNLAFNIAVATTSVQHHL